MVRVFCDKCCKVGNYYPNRNKQGKIINWTTISKKTSCTHKLSEEYVKKNKVVVKWFLADGRELIPQTPVKRWRVENG